MNSKTMSKFDKTLISREQINSIRGGGIGKGITAVQDMCTYTGEYGEDGDDWSFYADSDTK